MRQHHLLLAGTFVALLTLCLPAHAQDLAPMVQLVENHQSSWRIVSPSRDRAGVPYAVRELQKDIEMISGARLPIDDQPQDGATIVVGLRRDLPRDDQAALPPPASGFDGYAITVHAGDRPRVFVAGDTGCGTIYGVHELLERLGCRWFYPTQDPADPEVVPRTPSLSLPAGSRAVASPFRYRVYNGDAWYFDIHPENAIRQVDHAAKVRCNMVGWQCAGDKPLLEQYDALRQQGVLREIERRALTLHGPAHSFNLFLPNELAAEHPDWFGMRDGRRVRQDFFGAQFCWSNAAARRHAPDYSSGLGRAPAAAAPASRRSAIQAQPVISHFPNSGQITAEARPATNSTRCLLSSESTITCGFLDRRLPVSISRTVRSKK